MTNNIEKVKRVRERTGAGMNDINAALTLADGDETKAEDLLRLQGTQRAPSPLELQAQIHVLTYRVSDLERELTRLKNGE